MLIGGGPHLVFVLIGFLFGAANFSSSAAPSTALVVGKRILLLSGDDGSLAGFKPVAEHPGFDPTILAYDVDLDQWNQTGTLPAARVTAPCVNWNGLFVVPSGEVRPGVRSPEVWALDTTQVDPQK